MTSLSLFELKLKYDATNLLGVDGTQKNVSISYLASEVMKFECKQDIDEYRCLRHLAR